MTRIILDFFLKNKKSLWGTDPNTPYNKKILAVNAMYGWLYQQGILQKVCFEFRDYSVITEFAFDTADLMPYRTAMEQSGIENAHLAVTAIFDIDISPCNYSGAVQVSWTMCCYRDNGGCVGKSWECSLVQKLNMKEAQTVAQTYREHGAKQAVKAVFATFNWEPSDIDAATVYCSECGIEIPSDEARVLNDGTQEERRVCNGCHDAMWDMNHITKCENCGAWHETEYLNRPDPNLEFTPCPTCDHDIVEGYSREEASQYEVTPPAMTHVEENIVNITMMAAKLQSEGRISLDSDAVGFMGLTQEIIALAHQFEAENSGVDYNAEASDNDRDYWEDIDAFAEKKLLEDYGVEEPAEPEPLHIAVVVRDGIVETVRKNQSVPVGIDIYDINADFGDQSESESEDLAKVLDDSKYLDCDFGINHYCAD